MKYVSIDVETTGLDWHTCQIIQIGAVIDDLVTPIEELATFNCYIDQGIFKGEPYALSMHTEIFRQIAEAESADMDVAGDGTPVYCNNQVTSEFTAWLWKHGFRPPMPIIVAGKNYAAFDRNHLSNIPNWDLYVKMDHRFIDPGSMYFRPGVDSEIPGLSECLRRAGLPPHVKHTALEDALDVVRLIRHKMFDKDMEQRCLEAHAAGDSRPLQEYIDELVENNDPII